jgi:hypothetical protein
MAKYRAGAFDKGSRQRGQYVVVEAPSAADAIREVRKFFPGVPVSRFFVSDAEPYQKVDNIKHPFANAKPPRGSQ